jgi:hypothetical protein
VVEPPQARKSVGAEINYGVRFTGEADAENFVDQLAGGWPDANSILLTICFPVPLCSAKVGNEV